ncbi:fatty acid desaturase-domain-containing protein [Leucosporidium creatinivorum]|uniref:Acyl-CoA desaturase n=1 Tax=Leucosporidium creatinivorum TaxID=106004 RepID=A0A1Y2FXW5_9BASI|nr:fatty acid desaturase-domain-containing protein [Leucosporidium creatinivorum]
MVLSPAATAPKGDFWYSNATFFIGMHLLAFYGVVVLSPWSQLSWSTFSLCLTSWQLATFGITVGYHRLWSHRSFSASLPLRIVLAGMGCLGFQGSIKWWVLRHRLHHRYTDTSSDPYNAKQGLYHSHMGWIFRKPNYPRMALVDRKDLEADPVVRLQHRYYIPLTLGLGLGAPTLIGGLWDDSLGGFIWGGIIARLLIWHCTFAINSFAHFLGEQAYSEDVTARGNMLLAVVTGGEANHNYHHAFPKDYRNGPRLLDWDPTKWLIYTLHHLTPSLVPKIHQTPESEILKARAHVLEGRADRARSKEEAEESESSALGRKGGLPRWTKKQLVQQVSSLRADSSEEKQPILLLLLEGFAVDVSAYASEHPGGVAILQEFAVSSEEEVKDATESFLELNDHGWSAREKMRGLRVARVVD